MVTSVKPASSIKCLITLVVLLCFFEMFINGFNFNPKHLNLSERSTHWSSAGATWYGAPNGAGSDGGACGYGKIASEPPFSSMVTGIGPSLYQSGKECGACYEVNCTKHAWCSGKPVRVVITYSCPGGPCASESAHFDLSGTAFGATAVHGWEEELRRAGILEIHYARVGRGRWRSWQCCPNGDLQGEAFIASHAAIIGCNLEARCCLRCSSSYEYKAYLSLFRENPNSIKCYAKGVEAWFNL